MFEKVSSLGVKVTSVPVSPPASPRHLERPVGNAVGEAHFVNLARPADLELQRHGEGVDDRNADAVQATGDLVGILVEFSAGMKAAS